MNEPSQDPHDGTGSPRWGTAAAIAGQTAYRQEYRRDYGPDLDESLDGTEAWYEFSTPVIQATSY